MKVFAMHQISYSQKSKSALFVAGIIFAGGKHNYEE